MNTKMMAQDASRGTRITPQRVASDFAMTAVANPAISGATGGIGAVTTGASRLVRQGADKTVSEIATGLNTLNRGKNNFADGVTLAPVKPGSSRLVVAPEDAGRVIRENMGEIRTKMSDASKWLDDKLVGTPETRALSRENEQLEELWGITTSPAERQLIEQRIIGNEIAISNIKQGGSVSQDSPLLPINRAVAKKLQPTRLEAEAIKFSSPRELAKSLY